MVSKISPWFESVIANHPSTESKVIFEPLFRIKIFSLLTEEERLKRNIGTLPSNLEEAITELGRNEVLKDLLGNHASKAVIDAARNDIEKAKLEVTPWEIKRYL